mmetsp:Transcript_76499/g.234119  ORF Transcript_76499/g.234119 Transcript_76499/m.234119 type:complete len:260 (-) Transcript_76499:691-1470(-)
MLVPSSSLDLESVVQEADDEPSEGDAQRVHCSVRDFGRPADSVGDRRSGPVGPRPADVEPQRLPGEVGKGLVYLLPPVLHGEHAHAARCDERQDGRKREVGLVGARRRGLAAQQVCEEEGVQQVKLAPRKHKVHGLHHRRACHEIELVSDLEHVLAERRVPVVVLRVLQVGSASTFSPGQHNDEQDHQGRHDAEIYRLDHEHKQGLLDGYRRLPMLAHGVPREAHRQAQVPRKDKNPRTNCVAVALLANGLRSSAVART